MIRGLVQIPVPTWTAGTRTHLDTNAFERAVTEYECSTAAGLPVELVVGDVEAHPRFDVDALAWADEPPTVPSVPAVYTRLVRRAGAVQVVGAPWVVPGWVRLLQAAEAAA